MHGREEDHLSSNRPLSGGIWTFFSWLRRAERSSSDSLSSVGSDHSVASFDFLGPNEYVTSRPPLTISADDPTDTYNKRLHDRQIRRQRDHDMTIHRKYGLLRFEGYDSLPVKRSSLQPRQQRATSECYQRRTPYVPGKRRAPLPPTTGAAVTLPRYKRKRPAPKPPNVISQNNKENYEQKKLMQTGNTTEIESVVQSTSYKVTKDKDKVFRDSKNFLKQIFDNRKSLNIDTSHVKFLPSISELDKQALEIIERKKAFKSTMGDGFNHTNTSINPWICTKCLRKYQSTVVFCLHCQSNEVSNVCDSAKIQSKVNSNITDERVEKTSDEKEKLKLMLKEMKNSLPKKSVQKGANKTCGRETSTLRIGCNISDNQSATTSKMLSNTNFNIKELNPIPEVPRPTLVHSDILLHRVSVIDSSKQNSNNKTVRKDDLVQCSNTNIISKANVAYKSVGSNTLFDSNKDENKIKPGKCTTNKEENINTSIEQTKVDRSNKTNISSNIQTTITAPLKISSLLCPLKTYSEENNTNNVVLPSLSSEKLKQSNNKNVSDSLFQPLPSTSSNLLREGDQLVHISKTARSADKTILTSNDVKTVNKNLEILSHHSRRRNLVTQLEQSISKGDVKIAAEAAAELAKLRLSCSVLSFSSQIAADSQPVLANNGGIKILSITTNNLKSDVTHTDPKLKPQNSTKCDNTNVVITKPKEMSLNKTKSEFIKTDREAAGKAVSSKLNMIQTEELLSIKIWIEDKETARGPVKVNIGRHAIMEDLMQHADKYLGLPIHLQRWIVGKNLCTDIKTPLSALAGSDLSAPFYLCLVQSDLKENGEKTTSVNQVQKETPQVSNKDTCSDVYKELINLEKEAIVLNFEPFECEVCLELCGQGDGVVLRECIHIFCKKCVADAIKHCQEPVVACPAFNCSGTLQEREIRALLNLEEYERWLARGLVTAESGTRNTFHCRTTDCKGWAFCEPGVRRFPCPVCKQTNCIPCQAIHQGETCEEYKKKLKKAVFLSEKNQMDEETKSFLDSLIQKGEALACPECNSIITKKWGCDWIKCFACKTEICWVTKSRRWGPAGKGDISGGCRCGVDGKRCHPTCSYCH